MLYSRLGYNALLHIQLVLKKSGKHFDKLVAHLNKEYTKRELMAEIVESEFQDINQLEDESILDYAQALVKLAIKPVPDDEEQQEKTVRSRLIKGLRNENLCNEASNLIYTQKDISVSDLVNQLE